MKNYQAISLIVMVLTSCELVVDVDIPIEKNQLVVNSFFTPDSTWKAKVSLSRHILDQADHRQVENALVVLYSGDSPIDTLEHESLGYYRSDDGRPLHGQGYTIRVSAPDYNAAEASSRCPTPVSATFSTPQFTVGEFHQTIHTSM